MPRHITPHDALILNDMMSIGVVRPTIKGVVDSATRFGEGAIGSIPGSQRISHLLEARRVRDKREKIKKIGGLAAVNETALSDGRAENIIHRLQSAHLLGHHRIVGVQPIIFKTALEEYGEELSVNAEVFARTVKVSHPHGMIYLNPNPLIVDGVEKRSPIDTVYDAMVTASEDLTRNADEYVGDPHNTYVPPTSLVIVMGAGHMAQSMRGVTYDDVVRNGVAVLDYRGDTPSSLVWSPGLIDATAQEQYATDSELQENSGIKVVQPYTEIYY